MTNTTFVVFWLGHYHGSKQSKSFCTPMINARYKEFEDVTVAQKHFDKLSKLADAGEEYQSRIPSHVTKSW